MTEEIRGKEHSEMILDEYHLHNKQAFDYFFCYRVDVVAVSPWYWQKNSSQCQVTGDGHSISNFYYVRKTLLEE